MSKIIIAGMLALILVVMSCVVFAKPADWKGVDETVVEKIAEKAGRPPCDPIINTDKGDLLLFVFLVGGAVGGFVGGYYFRELFPPKPRIERS